MPADHQYPSGPPRISRVVGRDLPRASAADAARTLVDGATTGALSTVALDPAGYPFGSVVSYGLDERGAPLFVISALAEHTRNLGGDPRASLLVTEPDVAGTDPLARGRVTLVGDAAPVPDAEQQAAIALVATRVPAVAGYAGYGDFRCFRLAVRAIRWVGGFGEMDWVDADAYASADVDPVLPHRHGIAAHMNDDHADAGLLLCEQALGAPVAVGRRCATSTATAASTSPTSTVMTASPSSASGSPNRPRRTRTCAASSSSSCTRRAAR